MKVVLVAPLALVLSLSPAPRALAADGDPFLRGFEPVGKYEIWVDAKPASHAMVAVARLAGNVILLQGDELGGGLLLRPGERTAARIAAGKAMEEMDGTLALEMAPPPEVLGPFEIGEKGIAVRMDEHLVELRPAPYKLGPHTGQELLESNAEYVYNSRGYIPADPTLALLRRAKRPVTVRVFFGSWCPACSRRVPRILRIEKDLRSQAIHFEFFGLPSKFREDPEAKKFQVHSVPTGVVLSDGKEIGRLKGDLWDEPEASLLAVLREAGLLDA